MDELNAELLWKRTARLLVSMDQIVDAMIADLGESPEAIRGAECFAVVARIVVTGALDRDNHPSAEPHLEMQSVGVLLTKFCRMAEERLAELLPTNQQEGEK